MSVIDVPSGTTDFSGFVYSGVDLIRFVMPGSTAIFDASQFDGVQILSDVEFDRHLFPFGSGSVVVNNANALDASGWVFNDSGRGFVIPITMNGTSSNDSIAGSSHDDVIVGGLGKDTLLGGDGNDKIGGGDGRDSLTGGLRGDLLAGGAAADTFIYTSIADSTPNDGDRITDFKPGKDTIDLSAIDAVIGGSDDSFAFIGSAAFSGVAGELRFTPEHGPTFIEADVNGDGLTDLGFELNQHRTLSASDFIL